MLSEECEFSDSVLRAINATGNVMRHTSHSAWSVDFNVSATEPLQPAIRECLTDRHGGLGSDQASHVVGHRSCSKLRGISDVQSVVARNTHPNTLQSHCLCAEGRRTNLLYIGTPASDHHELRRLD